MNHDDDDQLFNEKERSLLKCLAYWLKIQLYRAARLAILMMP